MPHPKNRTTDNKRTEKRQTKCQRFAKLKEVFANAQVETKTPHLILPNRTQAQPPPN